MGLFDFVRRAGRALSNVVSGVKNVGEKVSSGIQNVGQKIASGIDFGQKALNTALRAGSDLVQRGTEALGLQKPIRELARGVRAGLKGLYDRVPGPLKGPVLSLWSQTPVSGIVEKGLLAADVLSGDRDLTEEDIARVYPQYAVVRNSIAAARGVSSGDKAAAKRYAFNAAKGLVTQMIKNAV